jgi:DNA-directed RNA polymerase specialized sigma24 family protein
MSSQTAEFVSVFMSERGRLTRLVSRIVRDPSIADDLVQETFLRVSGALGRAQSGACVA